MTTWTWQDYTPTPEEEEAWAVMEKEAERDGLLKAEKEEQRKLIWIGEFEFLKVGAGIDGFDLCLIHQIHEIRYCAEEDVHNEELDWVMPNEYEGSIAYSQTFMRNLGGNLKKFEGV